MQEVGGQVVMMTQKQIEFAYKVLKDILSVSLNFGIFAGKEIEKTYEKKVEENKNLKSGEVELNEFIKDGVQPISIGELNEKDLFNFEKNAHKYSLDYVKLQSAKDSTKYEILVDPRKLWRAERAMKDTLEEKVADILAERKNANKEEMLNKVKEVNSDQGLRIFNRANENSEFWDKQLESFKLNKNLIEDGLSKKENFIARYQEKFGMSEENFVFVPNKGIVHLDQNNMLIIHKLDTNTNIKVDLNGKDEAIKEIKRVIKEKNEIINYAKKQIDEKYFDYTLGQKNVIRTAIIEGYDVSKLDNKKYNADKMSAILACMEDGVNVNRVLIKDYNSEQIHGLRIAMNENVDLKHLEDETLTYKQMYDITEELKKAKAEGREVDINRINDIKNVIIGKTTETIENTVVITDEEKRNSRVKEIEGVHGEYEVGKDTNRESKTIKTETLENGRKSHEEVVKDIENYKNDMGETTIKTKTTINKEITKDNTKDTKSR